MNKFITIVFSLNALIASNICLAESFFGGILDISIPASFVRLENSPESEPNAMLKTEAIQFLNTKGTSFSATLLSGPDEIPDLQKAGLTIESVVNDECKGKSDTIKKEVSISNHAAAYQSCTITGPIIPVPVHHISISLFVDGRILTFNVFGRPSSEEIDKISDVIFNSKINVMKH